MTCSFKIILLFNCFKSSRVFRSFFDSTRRLVHVSYARHQYWKTLLVKFFQSRIILLLNLFEQRRRKGIMRFKKEFLHRELSCIGYVYTVSSRTSPFNRVILIRRWLTWSVIRVSHLVACHGCYIESLIVARVGTSPQVGPRALERPRQAPRLRLRQYWKSWG